MQATSRWFVLLSGGILVTASLLIVGAIRQRTPYTSLPVSTQVGSIAPGFSLCDYRGTEFQLSQFRGQWVLLSFFCGCAPCQQLATAWKELNNAEAKVAVLGISTLSPIQIRQFIQATQINFPILFDPGYAVAEQYDSTMN